MGRVNQERTAFWPETAELTAIVRTRTLTTHIPYTGFMFFILTRAHIVLALNDLHVHHRLTCN